MIIICRAIYLYLNFEYKYQDGKYSEYTIVIIEKIDESDKGDTYLAKLKQQNNRFVDKFRVNIYSNKNEYSYGDILQVKGKITIPEALNNEGEFNYKLYLNSKNIYGVITTYDVKYVENSSRGLLGIVYNFKKYVSSRIDKFLPIESAAILKGMVYGDTVSMPDTIKEDFEKIGISHLTAVSGANVALVLVVIVFLLDKVRLRKIIKLVIKIIFVVCFCTLSSFELSIIRASIMCIISLINEARGSKVSPYISLVLSIIIICMYNPFTLFNTGLQLSCMATLSILMFSARITKLLVNKGKGRGIIVRVVKTAMEYAALTISAQILILPLQINTFNTFPYTIIISNVIASFLDSPICILGLLAVMFSFIPVLNRILFYLTVPFSQTLIFLSKIISRVSITIPISSKSVIVWLFYYIFVGVIYFKPQFTSIKKYHVYKGVAFCLFVLLVISSSIYNLFFNNYIYFFNIGQGNMTYISYKGTNLVIDCGSTKMSNVLNAAECFIKKNNILVLDAVLVTHFDSDHINGILNLLKLCEVKQFIYPNVIPNNNQVKELFEALENEKATLICTKQGDKLEVGRVIIEVLMPENKELSEDTNYNSIVGIITLNDTTFLFMGDATKETEQVLIEQDLINNNVISIIQIGHHGSNTSTSDEFISYIKPQIGVISAKKSIYGHPHQSVLEILRKYGVIVYMTEHLGGIKIRI